jgi:hypothetical protein
MIDFGLIGHSPLASHAAEAVTQVTQGLTPSILLYHFAYLTIGDTEVCPCMLYGAVSFRSNVTIMFCAAPGTDSHSSHTILHFFVENKDGTIRIDPTFDSTDMSAQVPTAAYVPSSASAVASTWTSAGSVFTTAKAISAPVMSLDTYQVCLSNQTPTHSIGQT